MKPLRKISRFKKEPKKPNIPAKPPASVAILFYGKFASLRLTAFLLDRDVVVPLEGAVFAAVEKTGNAQAVLREQLGDSLRNVSELAARSDVDMARDLGYAGELPTNEAWLELLRDAWWKDQALKLFESQSDVEKGKFRFILTWPANVQTTQEIPGLRHFYIQPMIIRVPGGGSTQMAPSHSTVWMREEDVKNGGLAPRFFLAPMHLREAVSAGKKALATLAQGVVQSNGTGLMVDLMRLDVPYQVSVLKVPFSYESCGERKPCIPQERQVGVDFAWKFVWKSEGFPRKYMPWAVHQVASVTGAVLDKSARTWVPPKRKAATRNRKPRGPVRGRKAKPRGARPRPRGVQPRPRRVQPRQARKSRLPRQRNGIMRVKLTAGQKVRKKR